MKKNTNNGLIIYQAKNGGIEFKGDMKNETIWATQINIAALFDVSVKTVNEHIKNIYKTKELVEKRTIRKNQIVQTEGKREVRRDLLTYNLDTIIAVGYRVNSKTATQFRIWATKTLKQYISSGFVIDKKIVSRNYQKFLEAVEETKKLLPEASEAFKSGEGIDIATLFAKTWLSLDAYDKEQLVIKKPTKKNVKLTANELQESIFDLKAKLIKKGEATELFATDRHKNSLEGIVGNVMQSFSGKHVYESVEEKAAHLLYFIIKNHPFVDGNKRSGAFSFVWFLEKTNLLDIGRITPETLTALTILVAESNPAHKQNIIKLVMKLIEK